MIYNRTYLVPIFYFNNHYITALLILFGINQVWKTLQDKSIWDGPSLAFLSHEQSYADGTRRGAAYMKKIEEMDLGLEGEQTTVRRLALILQLLENLLLTFTIKIN